MTLTLLIGAFVLLGCWLTPPTDRMTYWHEFFRSVGRLLAPRSGSVSGG
jgi:hypothetical protein